MKSASIRPTLLRSTSFFTLFLILFFTLFSPLAFAQNADRPNLVVGVAGNPGGLDPATELSNVGTRVIYNLYDTLIERNFLSGGQGGGNELVPMLAESWERLSDTELELKLRDDVTFHNGEPLTSEDVKFTFERILDPDSPYIEAKGYFATFDRIETPDDATVRIITKEPDPPARAASCLVGGADRPQGLLRGGRLRGVRAKPGGHRPLQVYPDARGRPHRARGL